MKNMDKEAYIEELTKAMSRFHEAKINKVVQLLEWYENILRGKIYDKELIIKKVTAAISIKDGEVFLTKRASHVALADFWEFPGGKLENNETLEECVVRELYEELNIKCEAKKVLTSSIYHYEKGSIELIAILVKCNFENLNLSVHSKIEWIPIDKLLDYDLAPADIPIAQYLQEKRNEF